MTDLEFRDFMISLEPKGEIPGGPILRGEMLTVTTSMMSFSTNGSFSGVLPIGTRVMWLEHVVLDAHVEAVVLLANGGCLICIAEEFNSRMKRF